MKKPSRLKSAYLLMKRYAASIILGTILGIIISNQISLAKRVNELYDNQQVLAESLVRLVVTLFPQQGQ